MEGKTGSCRAEADATSLSLAGRLEQADSSAAHLDLPVGLAGRQQQLQGRLVYERGGHDGKVEERQPEEEAAWTGGEGHGGEGWRGRHLATQCLQ